MGYAVTVIGARAATSDADACSPIGGVARAAAGVVRFAVVATQGQWDEEATAAALALDRRPLTWSSWPAASALARCALLAEQAGEAALTREEPGGVGSGRDVAGRDRGQHPGGDCRRKGRRGGARRRARGQSTGASADVKASASVRPKRRRQRQRQRSVSDRRGDEGASLALAGGGRVKR